MAPNRRSILVPLTVATILLSRSANADEANRNFLPFGERAAFLGNAGITSQRGEAVFYNPANLARIGHPNLSVSGSTFLRFELSADPLLQIEGVDQPFEASGFVAIPSTLVSTYQIGSWSLATAVLVPEALSLKNRVTFDSPTLHVTVLQESEQESLWLGGGLAREIVPGLTAGVSVFAAKESASDLSFIRFQVQNDQVLVSEVTSNSDISVLNLLGIAGLYWEPHPKLGVGARVQIPPVKLTGGGDIYLSALTTGEVDEAVEQEFEDVNVSKPLPWDMGAGVSFRPSSRLELMVDVNVQLPDTLTTMDDPDVGTETVKVELAPRAGVGAEWEFLSQKWLRIGLLYNGSALAEPETDDDPPKEDYYGVTGGLAWQSGRTHTALGGFFLYSPVSLIVGGSDPPRESDARGLLYGALFTVSYRL